MRVQFVEAVADVRGGADAVRCRCQGDGCCKDKNQTILGDSLGRQGGRPLSRDGYAPASFLVRRLRKSNARTGERQELPAGAIDTAMKTFHDWLAERMAKNEGLWLNDKNAVVGISNINPLLQKKAKVKPLKLPKAKLGVADSHAMATPDYG